MNFEDYHFILNIQMILSKVVLKISIYSLLVKT
jgi:hypothetical protein